MNSQASTRQPESTAHQESRASARVHPLEQWRPTPLRTGGGNGFADSAARSSGSGGSDSSPSPGQLGGRAKSKRGSGGRDGLSRPTTESFRGTASRMGMSSKDLNVARQRRKDDMNRTMASAARNRMSRLREGAEKVKADVQVPALVTSFANVALSTQIVAALASAAAVLAALAWVVEQSGATPRNLALQPELAWPSWPSSADARSFADVPHPSLAGPCRTPLRDVPTSVEFLVPAASASTPAAWRWGLWVAWLAAGNTELRMRAQESSRGSVADVGAAWALGGAARYRQLSERPVAVVGWWGDAPGVGGGAGSAQEGVIGERWWMSGDCSERAEASRSSGAALEALVAEDRVVAGWVAEGAVAGAGGDAFGGVAELSRNWSRALSRFRCEEGPGQGRTWPARAEGEDVLEAAGARTRCGGGPHCAFGASGVDVAAVLRDYRVVHRAALDGRLRGEGAGPWRLQELAENASRAGEPRAQHSWLAQYTSPYCGALVVSAGEVLRTLRTDLTDLCDHREQYFRRPAHGRWCADARNASSAWALAWDVAALRTAVDQRSARWATWGGATAPGARLAVPVFVLRVLSAALALGMAGVSVWGGLADAEAARSGGRVYPDFSSWNHLFCDCRVGQRMWLFLAASLLMQPWPLIAEGLLALAGDTLPPLLDDSAAELHRRAATAAWLHTVLFVPRAPADTLELALRMLQRSRVVRSVTLVLTLLCILRAVVLLPMAFLEGSPLWSARGRLFTHLTGLPDGPTLSLSLRRYARIGPVLIVSLFTIGITTVCSFALQWSEQTTCLHAAGSPLHPFAPPGGSTDQGGGGSTDPTSLSANLLRWVTGSSESALADAARAWCEPPNFARSLETTLLSFTTTTYFDPASGTLGRVTLVLAAVVILMLGIFAVSTVLLYISTSPAEDLVKLMHDRAAHFTRGRRYAASAIQAAWRFSRVSRAGALWEHPPHFSDMLVRPASTLLQGDDALHRAVLRWRHFRLTRRMRQANMGTAPRLRILAAWSDVRLHEARFLVARALDSLKQLGVLLPGVLPPTLRPAAAQPDVTRTPKSKKSAKKKSPKGAISHSSSSPTPTAGSSNFDSQRPSQRSQLKSSLKH